ncbi:transposable element Tcb1 transposase [Trichonephila clavipes]|nr:transposable element Tcb1 transposase [Trichonephila clavipes]
MSLARNFDDKCEQMCYHDGIVHCLNSHVQSFMSHSVTKKWQKPFGIRPCNFEPPTSELAHQTPHHANKRTWSLNKVHVHQLFYTADLQWQMDRRGRSNPPQCTTSREDRLIVRMAVTDRSVTSRTIAQHIESVTHHSVSACTIRRRLQQSGQSARRSLLGLPLTQNHRSLCRQWCDERM